MKLAFGWHAFAPSNIGVRHPDAAGCGLAATAWHPAARILDGSQTGQKFGGAIVDRQLRDKPNVGRWKQGKRTKMGLARKPVAVIQIHFVSMERRSCFVVRLG